MHTVREMQWGGHSRIHLTILLLKCTPQINYFFCVKLCVSAQNIVPNCFHSHACPIITFSVLCADGLCTIVKGLAIIAHLIIEVLYCVSAKCGSITCGDSLYRSILVH